MIELGEIGQDAPLVELLAGLHVADVEQRRDVQLPLRHAEGDLAVPVNNEAI